MNRQLINSKPPETTAKTTAQTLNIQNTNFRDVQIKSEYLNTEDDDDEDYENVDDDVQIESIHFNLNMPRKKRKSLRINGKRTNNGLGSMISIASNKKLRRYDPDDDDDDDDDEDYEPDVKTIDFATQTTANNQQDGQSLRSQSKEIKLGDIDGVRANLQESNQPKLYAFYRLCYGDTKGVRMAQMRTNICNFEGFKFSIRSDEYGRKLKMLQRFGREKNLQIFRTLGVKKFNSTMHELDSLLRFLIGPITHEKYENFRVNLTNVQKPKSPSHFVRRSTRSAALRPVDYRPPPEHDFKTNETSQTIKQQPGDDHQHHHHHHHHRHRHHCIYHNPCGQSSLSGTTMPGTSTNTNANVVQPERNVGTDEAQHRQQIPNDNLVTTFVKKISLAAKYCYRMLFVLI